MWKENFQKYKLDLGKVEEQEIQLPTSSGSKKKKGNFKKNYFCFIDYAKAWTMWVTANCGKFFKRWEYQITSHFS